MTCIKTDNGNLFVRTKVGDVEIYFFINPKTGKHLDDEMEYHPSEFYEQAVETWHNKEQEIPEENIPHVKVIVQKYLDQKKLDGTYMKSEPATNSMGDLLKAALEKKK